MVEIFCVCDLFSKQKVSHFPASDSRGMVKLLFAARDLASYWGVVWPDYLAEGLKALAGLQLLFCCLTASTSRSLL